MTQRDEPAREHECPACGSTTIERHHLTLMARLLCLVHTKERRYVCCDCGEEFWDWPLPTAE